VGRDFGIALGGKSILCPSRISSDSGSLRSIKQVDKGEQDQNHPEDDTTMDIGKTTETSNSPSLVRSPSLIRYNTSPDIHRRAAGIIRSQSPPVAPHQQLYAQTFRSRMPSVSSSSAFHHPLSSPSTTINPTFASPATGTANHHHHHHHHRTNTELDWLYDRNAELELEVDKLGRQVKVQNMVARNEGRRAAAKIDALEAALMDMERQNAKLIAEGKRAKIREKRGAGLDPSEMIGSSGVASRYLAREASRMAGAAPAGYLDNGQNTRESGRSNRSPSPENSGTVMPRRRSSVHHDNARNLASELGLSNGSPERRDRYGSVSPSPVRVGNTPPVNDIPLVELPAEPIHDSGSPTTSLEPAGSRLIPSASQNLSPPASNVSGLPDRTKRHLSPYQLESTPSGLAYSPNSFPSSRLGNRNRSRLFQSSHSSTTASNFHVWTSPASSYHSPASTLGMPSRLTGGRQTLASELASWALDMDDETLEEQEAEAVLHEAGLETRDTWKTTRSGRYSLLEKEHGVRFDYPPASNARGEDHKKTAAPTGTTPPSGWWFSRLFNRIKRIYQSSWIEIQFIWIVLIFLRRVWIEGRQGLILRSKMKAKKAE